MTSIRVANPGDLATLARMGASLAREHHGFDPERFFLTDDVERGYHWWLSKELENANAVVLVAEQAGVVAGYAYGRLEERDWNALLDAHGGFHDLWLDEAARGKGLGAALSEEMLRRLSTLGAPRVVLKTAAKNLSAQRLFARLGWRPTMIEMTREAPGRSPADTPSR